MAPSTRVTPAIAGKSDDRDRGGQIVADTGPGEDLLDDDDAGEHHAELQPGHRQRGPDRVAHHVICRPPAVRSDPWSGPSARSRHAARLAARTAAPGPSRRPARWTAPARAAPDAAAHRKKASVCPCSRVSSACMPVGPGSSKFPTPRAGSHPELAEEHDDADQCQQERRRRRQQQQHTPPDRGAGPAQRTGQRVQRRQDQRDDERGDDEFDGGRQVGGQIGGHRLPGAQRAAQVPGEQPSRGTGSTG